MATRKVDTDLDFNGVGKLIRAIINPVSADPGTPAVGEVWYNTTDNRLKTYNGASVKPLAYLDDVTGGAITGALWDAQSVITAVLDDTPQATILGASTVLGRRAAGDIGAVTYANLLADLEALGITADTLGTSSEADVLNRANHTGTQLHTTISDFDTEVNALITAAETAGFNADTLDSQDGLYYLSRANHTGTQLSSTISDFNTAADARAQAIVDALVDAAPGTLDTLNEIAAALGDDPNFATTMTNALATKTEKFAANIGNGALQTFTVTHSLGSTDVTVSVRQNSDGAMLDAQVVVTDANNVQITTNSTPTTDQYRVVVIG